MKIPSIHHILTVKGNLISNPMRSGLKSCVLTLLLLVSAAGAQAAHTNLVQNLTFKLTAWSQGSTVTNGNLVTVSAITQSIITKDIIDWLGLATTNSFTNAQLLMVNDFGEPATKSVVIVRSRIPLTKKSAITNDVDVSDFFASVTYAATVNNYSYNNTNNAVNPGTYYGYWGFYLLSDTNHPALPVTFQVSGLGVDSAVNLVGKKKQVFGVVDQFSITNAAGIGQVNGHPFIIAGNISITGKTLEITP